MSRLHASELNASPLHGAPRGANATVFNALSIPSQASVFRPTMRATIQPAPFASSALPWAWLIPDGTLFVGEVLCVDPTTDCEAPASLLPMATTTKDITQPLEVTVDFTHVLETGDTLVAADVELVQSEKQSAPLDLVAQVISDAKTRLFLLLEGGEPFSDVWLNVLGYAKTGAAYSGRFRIRPFDVTQIRAFSHA